MYIYCVIMDVPLQLSAPQLQIGVTVTLMVTLRLDRDLAYVFFSSCASRADILYAHEPQFIPQSM